MAIPKFISIGLLFCFGANGFTANPLTEIAVQVPAAIAILDRWHTNQPETAERYLTLVYWTPADREPSPQYRERLTRSLHHVQAFYLKEMERLGFGKKTIRFHEAADGLLEIHLVRGDEAYQAYATESGSKIRKECLPTLRERGIDADQETIVIFCNMANWDESAKSIRQNSPYYAGGNASSGTAWQVDSPILDIDRIGELEPIVTDGQYGRISVGKYNTIFIGGIAHELGHALGLPHNRQRADQQALFGTALMGSGNHTYSHEIRGEGKGTFITLAHGLRLASHPMFSGSVKGLSLPAQSVLEDLQVEPEDTSFTVTGRLNANPPAYAMVAYLDPEGGSDYDATTETSIPDSSGRFRFECRALVPGKKAQMRIVTLHVNGKTTQEGFYYDVKKEGKVDLAQWKEQLTISPFLKAFIAHDETKLRQTLEAIEQSDVSKKAKEAAAHLFETQRPSKPLRPFEVREPSVLLANTAYQDAKTGYGPPMINRLPELPILLYASNELFSTGLYAHAPSTYTWILGKKWSRLQGRAGLAQGHDGSVVFSILGDDKPLWQSKIIKASQLADFDIDTTNVEKLDLQVSDAGDGRRSDWGLWLEPKLIR